MPITKRVEAMSLAELADLLSYYSVYDTTRKSGEDSRPSGPEFQAFLQKRLRDHDKSYPKPVKEPGAHILVDLYLLYEAAEQDNLLLNLEKTFNPYLHGGHKALKRKPKEISREVLLALFEANLFVGKWMQHGLLLLIHEDPFKPDDSQSVHIRGLDWVIYTKQPTIAQEYQQ